MEMMKKYWAFILLSAGVHLLVALILMGYTTRPMSAKMIEISLSQLSHPGKRPGAKKELPPPPPPAKKEEPIANPAYTMEELAKSAALNPQLSEPETRVSSVYSVNGTGQPGPYAEGYAEYGDGEEGGSDPVFNEYLWMVKDRINMSKNYPLDARKRGEKGDVGLKFKIFPDGSVADIKVIKSSGSAVLDDASVRLVRSVAPFPPSPKNFSFSIKISISYTL